MSDWRAKPRTGKYQFMQFITEIKSRIDNGETQNSIFNDLKAKDFKLSYPQFNRYVNKLVLNKQKNEPVKKNISLNKKTEVEINKTESKGSENKTDLKDYKLLTSLDEWQKHTQVDSERLAKRLEMAGYSIKEVQSWKLNSSFQISNRLNMLESNNKNPLFEAYKNVERRKDDYNPTPDKSRIYGDDD